MPVDGAWNISMNTPLGPQQAKLNLVSDGGVLNGTWQGPRGSATIAGGTVELATVAWTVRISGPMGEVSLNFEGVVDGDTLTGKVRTPRGENAFTGTRA